MEEEAIEKLKGVFKKNGDYRGGSTITTLHFRNLPKTERKFIEEAIRELLVKRKLLHISFIGNSVMELLVEKR